jgi:RNA polymerase primary sigma factor
VTASEELISQIESELSKTPGRTAPQLAQVIGVHKTELNPILYNNPKFIKDDSQRPRWFLSDGTQISVTERQTVTPRDESKHFAITGLREWQIDALKAWNENGSKGIVEAVTGAGKTLLAIAAIAQELNLGGKAAVIVPSIELQDQWLFQLKKHFPTAAIGALGNGSKDFLSNHDIIVAIVNTASTHSLGLEDIESGILVADECHHLAAPIFKNALELVFESRLGITATRERPDGAHADLEEYFGEVVYSIGYREAIEKKYVSGVNVLQVAVQLSTNEQDVYDELSERISLNQYKLCKRFNLSTDPYPQFMEAVVRISEDSESEYRNIARGYISAVSKRKSLLAETPKKFEVVKFLSSALENSNGAIFFSETINAAKAIESVLLENHVKAATLSSELGKKERSQVLKDFENGVVKAISVVKVIDQGVDVPEADVAVIISASKTKRQMIQRMGRVLRPKADGRNAVFILVFVAGSSEDPRLGAHDAFWGEVLDIAENTQLIEIP